MKRKNPKLLWFWIGNIIMENDFMSDKGFSFGAKFEKLGDKQGSVVKEKETPVISVEKTTEIEKVISPVEICQVQPNITEIVQPISTQAIVQPVSRGRGRPKKNASPLVATPSNKTACQEFIELALKKSGRTSIPSLESLFEGKVNLQKGKLTDIAVFSSNCPSDKALQEIRSQWKATNTLHQNADVNGKRVFDVAVQILEAGKMYMCVEVAKLPTGDWEAFSGRHRLAALAILYGTDIIVPFVFSEYNLSNAKDAVIVANQTRKIGALEKSEHRVFGHIHEEADKMEREEIYRKAVKKKGDVSEYCVYSVFSAEEYGMKLHFNVSTDSTRNDNALTTITGIKGFWKKSILWDDSMTRKDFDSSLRETVSFLNSLVETMQENKAFDSKQHLSSMVLVAIGGIYRHFKDAGKNPADSVKKLSKAIIDAGEIARQKSDKTYRDILKVIS